MNREGAPWLLLAAPLIIAAVSLPMAFDLVEPNGFYGVRTAATRASEAAWYRANRAAGQVGLAAGVIGFAGMVAVFRSAMPAARKQLAALGIVTGIAIAIAVAGVAAA